MAIRNIRVIGDEILTKKAKEVKEMTDKTRELVQDMLDTMYEADGVGLAAPQVGILKRIAVIDISPERDSPIILINPVITHTDDMLETMYEAGGVGLAAPQVGVLKRIVVIDVGDGPFVLINPQITKTEGSQTGDEGCLSVPGKAGIVTRPNIVRAKAYDLDMNEFEIEGEELLARALIHEIEHLDGQLYVDKVEGQLVDVDEEMED